MPEQFPYPTDGWSTGKMRKKGDRMRQGLEGDITEGARALGEQSPLIQSIEQQHQERMKVQGIPEKMKQYLPRSGVGAAEVRELEGIRKEKTQHLSQAGGGQYETKLTAAEETAFQAWKKKYAPKDSGEDYDLRGAFRSGLRPDPETGHWPDTYKKPNHPTFSDQSIYARERPDLAGRWEGDTYIPPGREI
jgi:hypothetical protein